LWIGGAEMVVRHLARSIDRRHFNVSVCYLRQSGQIGDELAREGIDIVGVSERSGQKTDYLTFVKLLRIIRDRRIDVLHTHTTHGLVDATLCKLLLPRLRVVHTFHFGNYPHTRPRVLWMEGICSRFADRLCAVGEVQRQQLRSVFRFREDRLRTVWNGVTPPTGSSDPEFRKRIGAENCILVGTIATLIEQKGLSDLLATARIVKDKRNDVKFSVVGDGGLRARLESERDRLRLEDTVVFTGWVPRAADVAMPVFDVFFQPSLWEAMSMVTLEAMAAEKPVVVTDVGENPHIIDDGVNGLVVRPRDVDAMVLALLRLVQDERLRKRLGRAAKRTFEEHFTVGRMVSTYEKLYLEALRR
jgi:glycosyltransferase involved in cell wall biosynthesis